MAIQFVSKLVGGGRKFLEALRGDAREIALDPTPPAVFLFVSLSAVV